VLARPGGRQPPQPGSLSGADHLERGDRAERGADPAGLDLDDDELMAVERDDVELAPDRRRAGIALHDAPPAALELSSYDGLCPAAQPLAASGHVPTVGRRGSPVARVLRRIRRST
jgi:hypothetical protein